MRGLVRGLMGEQNYVHSVGAWGGAKFQLSQGSTILLRSTHRTFR